MDDGDDRGPGAGPDPKRVLPGAQQRPGEPLPAPLRGDGDRDFPPGPLAIPADGADGAAVVVDDKEQSVVAVQRSGEPAAVGVEVDAGRRP